jgi:hypothetical protein
VPAGKNHGAYVKNVQALLNDLQKAGVITSAQKDALSSCAGQNKNVSFAARSGKKHH